MYMQILSLLSVLLLFRFISTSISIGGDIEFKSECNQSVNQRIFSVLFPGK